MLPVAFRIPFLERDVPGYGLMMMIAFLTSIWWATRRAVRSGGNPDVILNCGFVALIAGVVGARLMFVAHYWEQFAHRGGVVGTLWAIVDVSKGGLEFYGGFVATLLSVVAWLVFYEKVSLRWYFDIMAPSSALGLAIGRVGCLLNGCCYGSTCDLPWAVRFPFGSSATIEQWQGHLPHAALPHELIFVRPFGAAPLARESLAASDAEIAAAEAAEKEAKAAAVKAEAAVAAAPAADKARAESESRRAQAKLRAAVDRFGDLRHNMTKYGHTAAEIRAMAAERPSLLVHPTQVYSTITAGIIAFFLNALYWRRTRDGQVIFALLLIEPCTRWMIEVLRADNPVDTLGTFTISQFMALVMMAIGAGGLWWLRSQPPRSPKAVWWEEPPPPAKAKATA